jgi:alpha/beta superfamily hydrolase
MQRVRFPAAGDQPAMLEGELWRPEAGHEVPGVVITHPHPQRGGSMHNNVVAALGEGLSTAGIAWLRFNFRGVGASEGRFGDGVDERLDVLGALAYLAEQPRIAADRIGLAGYSFGARVSLGVIGDASQVRGLLCVAPPLREPPAPTSIACPYLVLVGDRDTNVADGVEHYAACLPDPDRLQVVQGTDHFWWGFESVLSEAAQRFFLDALVTGPLTLALSPEGRGDL